MISDLLGPVQEVGSMLGISARMVVLVLTLTVILSVSSLMGHTARIGVWIEDVRYRLESRS